MLQLDEDFTFISDADFLVDTAHRAQPILLTAREIQSYRNALYGCCSKSEESKRRYETLVAQCLLVLQGSLFVPLKFHGCIGFTVHEVATSQCFTVVLDLDYGAPTSANSTPLPPWYQVPPRQPLLLAAYPSVDCSICSIAEVRGRKFWISWNVDLPSLDRSLVENIRLDLATGIRTNNPHHDPIERAWKPFCCRDIVKMHNRRLRKDNLFQALLMRTGSNPDIVFEVKTMQPRKGLYDARFFRLVDNNVEEVVNGTEYVTKIHAFKNYFCYRHDYWYSVDLFTLPASLDAVEADASGSSPSAKTHKMRMSPFTRIDNIGVMQRFFTCLGFPDLATDASAAAAPCQPDESVSDATTAAGSEDCGCT